MKAILLYAAAIVGSHFLYRASELWYGAEWIFGLLVAGWFALFLGAWKRIQPGGAGLIVVTAFSLMDILSIFLLQNLPAAICSLLIGLLLVPSFRTYPDVVLTSMGFVLSTILICIEVESATTIWMLFFVYGILAVIGFRCHLRWLKRCFIVLFSLAVPMLLLNYVLEGAYLTVLGVLLGTTAVIADSLKFSRQPLT